MQIGIQGDGCVDDARINGQQLQWTGMRSKPLQGECEEFPDIPGEDVDKGTLHGDDSADGVRVSAVGRQTIHTRDLTVSARKA